MTTAVRGNRCILLSEICIAREKRYNGKKVLSPSSGKRSITAQPHAG